MQHDGRLRDHGKSKQASFRAINHIPHLHISGDHDSDNYHLALFTNDVQYRVSAEDSDDISAMTTGQYTLIPVDDHLGVVNLEIQDEVLNEPFIEATKELDHIVEEMKAYFGGGRKRNAQGSYYQINPRIPLLHSRRSKNQQRLKNS
jgi:hypothetical protein